MTHNEGVVLLVLFIRRGRAKEGTEGGTKEGRGNIVAQGNSVVG